MNVQLKKFSINKPKVKIKKDFFTISRESHNDGILPVNMLIYANTLGHYVFGNLEVLEVE